MNSFIQLAGSSLQTFRYFSKRSLSVLQDHVCTWVIEMEGQVVAYGHLDREGEAIWLGIAVAQAARGRGLGRQMMQRLMKSAIEHKIHRVGLSVDSSNTKAIRLYEDFGFRLRSEYQSVRYYEWRSDLSVETRG